MFFVIVLMFDETKHQARVNTNNMLSNFLGVKVKLKMSSHSRIPFTITIFVMCHISHFANMLMDTPPSRSVLIHMPF